MLVGQTSQSPNMITNGVLCLPPVLCDPWRDLWQPVREPCQPTLGDRGKKRNKYEWQRLKQTSKDKSVSTVLVHSWKTHDYTTYKPNETLTGYTLQHYHKVQWYEVKKKLDRTHVLIIVCIKIKFDCLYECSNTLTMQSLIPSVLFCQYWRCRWWNLNSTYSLPYCNSSTIHVIMVNQLILRRRKAAFCIVFVPTGNSTLT